MSTPTAPSPLDPLAQRLEEAEALDPVAAKVGKVVRSVIKPGVAKDLLAGTWLGHALHPILTDVVIGAWTSASILDLIGGAQSQPAARRLIGVGIAAYPVTAVTGAHDWADTELGDTGARRLGLVHAATNAVALGLYTASLAARRRGDRGRGTVLALAGGGALAAGGWMGGHMAFVEGVGVDQTAFDPGPTDWTAAMDATDLGPGATATAVVADTPVMVHRAPAGLRALHDRCSHRGCSLAGGTIADGYVECPCHGSRFDLEHGTVLRGPATSPQPAFEARESGGRIEVRRKA
jgi:nitrite reductase/ring-hydroxylating ferredoxin subunit